MGARLVALKDEEAVQAAIQASGAKAGELQSTMDEPVVRHSELKVLYRTDQPTLTQVSQSLDSVAQQSGSQVIEHSSERSERQQLARELTPAASERTAELTR
ncbi:hypothetical protein GCM10027346_40640 [Hymenobacter seoulensis]